MKNGMIESIVIVGGGTSGWMSAAYISKALPQVQVTVVESSDIPTIGVGEATVAAITTFMDYLGLKEKEWMPACNGSYKYGIRFNDWYERGHHYWHPFEGLAYVNSNLHVGQYWYQHLLAAGGDRGSFYTDCFLGVGACEHNRVLKTPGGPDYVHTYSVPLDGAASAAFRVPYAYHFDAGLFGEYLKTNIAKPNGVEQIIDTVTEVHLGEDGFIEQIDTEGGRQIRGDLFLDCTGFRSLLLDKTLREPFEHYSETLFADRAIAMRVPYEDPYQEMHPYTTTTALSAGWVWNIPVTERIGTGYVYCSGFKSPDEAEQELRAHVGEERSKDIEARHLDIGRVGKHRNTWVKNCVGIGLSSGFLEPLESTSLHFVFIGVAKLVEGIGGGYFNTPIVATYNRFINDMMVESRDFIAAHYALTKREDTPYWRHVKYDTVIPDGLADFLLKSRQALPNALSSNIIFKESSWACILVGMNFLPSGLAYSNIPQQDVQRQQLVLNKIRETRARLATESIHHCDYLTQMGGAN